jgi:hypothetical protein
MKSIREHVKRTAGAAILLLIPLLSGQPAAAQSGYSCQEPVLIASDAPLPAAFSVPTDTFPVEPSATFFCSQKSGVPASRVVWFSFTPDNTGAFRLDTAGSEARESADQLDTILAVFANECDALTPLSSGCGDNSPGSLNASVTLTLLAGKRYLIAVGSNGSRNPLDGGVEPPPAGTAVLNIRPAVLAYPFEYVLPLVQRFQSGSPASSDLFLSNLEGSDGAFKLQFLSHGNPGDETPPASQPETKPMSIGADGTRELNDILGLPGTFALRDAYGALVIRSSRRLAAGARTQLAGAAGPVGHFSHAVDVSTGLLTLGESGRLIGIRDDLPPAENGYRAYLVLLNRSSATCTVLLKLRNGSGGTFKGGDAEMMLPPNTTVERGLRQIFPIEDAVRSAAVVISLRDGETGCVIGGAAVVADGPSGDAYATALVK